MNFKSLFTIILFLQLSPAHGACDGLIKNSVLLESARQVQLPTLEALKAKPIEESLKLLTHEKVLIRELMQLEKTTLPAILEAKYYQDTRTLRDFHLKLKELATDEQHKIALDSIESQLNKILENTNEEVLNKDIEKMIEDFKAASANINTENALRFGSADLDAIHGALSTELFRLNKQRTQLIDLSLDSKLTKILGIIDNVERMMKEGFKNQPGSPLKSELGKFREEILSKLKEYNVSPVESLNQKYNVDLHEAITTVPIPGKEPGTIIDVFENGYTVGTRLLRAARVVVAQ